MAVKIKLMRLGKMRAPYYRIVVADARTKRDGRVIETIGKYHPKEDPSFIEVKADRAAYWLGVGAQPTEPVTAILKVTGDWQKFKGLPAPPPMLVAKPKADKKIAFEAAAKEGAGTPTADATTPKSRKAPAKKTADPSSPSRPTRRPWRSRPKRQPRAESRRSPPCKVAARTHPGRKLRWPRKSPTRQLQRQPKHRKRKRLQLTQRELIVPTADTRCSRRRSSTSSRASSSTLTMSRCARGRNAAARSSRCGSTPTTSARSSAGAAARRGRCARSMSASAAAVRVDLVDVDRR